MHSFDHYLEEYVPHFHRLWITGAMAGWNHATTGKLEYAEESAKIQAEYCTLLAKPVAFAQLKAWRKDGSVTDPLKEAPPRPAWCCNTPVSRNHPN